MSENYYEACENCKGNYANCEFCKKIYKQGVRDMWEATRYNCYSSTMEHEGCCSGFDKNDDCDIETCPIAQKLLKGVK